ncbi:MAG: tetratricopeptide repeat protein [Rhodospirillaceae bacterium]|nr:tetratricopeptide repeat protein [Rhodospirillaceae bacterium]
MRLLNSGQIEAAAVASLKVLAVRPSDPDALNIMGLVEARLGRLDVAVDYMARVAKLRPKSAEAQFNLGCAHHQVRQFSEAERCYRQALRIEPKHAGALNNLGILHQDRDDLATARVMFERALDADPGWESAVINLYGVYRALGDFERMEALARRALARWPTGPQHWLNHGEALFQLGRFDKAWDCFEWRFRATSNAVVSRTVGGLPAWRGEDLTGKSLLTWTEQGPGDEIMFGTMIADLRKRVGRLCVLCSPRMRPLFERSMPEIEVIDAIACDADLSRFDVQAPLVSLAKLVRNDLRSFASNTAYLVPDRSVAITLGASYRRAPDELLVGIAWRSSGVADAHQKTINLGSWGALFALPKVRFVNLQYGDCSQELTLVKAEFGVEVLHDATVDPIQNLDHFAAQVAAMDVVVCSSNTAAHMAGALGVRTYAMVPRDTTKGGRWYWFERGGRCAWYPSLTLLRPRKPGEWADVIREATFEVARLVYQHGQQSEIATFMLRLASAYRKAGQSESMVATLDALARLPGQAPRAFLELAHHAKEAGNLGEAEAHIDRALALRPDWWEALNQKGAMLAERNDYAGAEVLYRRGLQAMPGSYELNNNLGTALRRQGRGIEADHYYKAAVDVAPDQASILLNIATNMSEIGRNDEAIAYFDRLLFLKPDYAEAHYSRGFCLLTSGRFKEGWPELRWRHQSHPNGERPPHHRPLFWDGEPLAQRSVLIWTEHGLGDELLTLTILPDVLAVARDVTVGCSDRLLTVLRRSFPSVLFVPRSQLPSIDVSRFDCQMTLSELGQAFRSSLTQFPARVSFLKADAQRRAAMRSRYARSAQDFVIGLSWASANPDIGALKNLNLGAMLTALQAAAAGTDRHAIFLSLQYGDCAAVIAEVKQKSGIEIIDDLSVVKSGDMDSFAAQVAAVDAVVTISNTTAHFSGALGIPTLLLLPYNRGRHWYWLRSQPECLWYSSIKYFLQSSDGNWDMALNDCRGALRGLMAPGNTFVNPN